MLYRQLEQTIVRLEAQFDEIPATRKLMLKQVAEFASKQKNEPPAVFNFICTHNSRRSHLAQLWAQTAAFRYGIEHVVCLSGGTEATAFNPRAVAAMATAGFQIRATTTGTNPVYEVRFAENAPALRAFSKTFDDPVNRLGPFAAVMTCAQADEHCPFIPEAKARIVLTYDDPKAADGTPEEATRYTERAHQIGRELLYAFSLVNDL